MTVCPNTTTLHMQLNCSGKKNFSFFLIAKFFRRSKNILIVSGAGISVNCGIPDFRSTKGIYASLKQTFPDLPHPTAMFDIDYFRKRPQPFYSFAKVTILSAPLLHFLCSGNFSRHVQAVSLSHVYQVFGRSEKIVAQLHSEH